MKKIDLTNWKRKEHFDFFSKMASPIFGLVTEVRFARFCKSKRKA
jgi:chloramphenicol O-acetyltransferase type A